MKLDPCEMAGLLDKHGYDFFKKNGPLRGLDPGI